MVWNGSYRKEKNIHQWIMYTGALVEINNTQYLLTEEYTGLLYLSYKLIGAAT